MARARHEKFELAEVHRSELKNAPYNPRHIKPKNRQKLRGVLKRLGMVSPITWNRRSGNIVGGHQRVDILDALEGTKDYTLTVAAVDLDEKQEREANLALNNQGAAGEFDYEKMLGLFKGEAAVEPEAAGFDMAELYQMFGESPFAESPKHLEKLSRDLRELREAHDKFREAIVSRDDTDFYLVAVFRCYDDRKAFTDLVACEDNRYVDGRALAALAEERDALLRRVMELEGRGRGEAGGEGEGGEAPREGGGGLGAGEAPAPDGGAG
jgi:hypothetical protein